MFKSKEAKELGLNKIFETPIPAEHYLSDILDRIEETNRLLSDLSESISESNRLHSETLEALRSFIGAVNANER